MEYRNTYRGITKECHKKSTGFINQDTTLTEDLYIYSEHLYLMAWILKTRYKPRYDTPIIDISQIMDQVASLTKRATHNQLNHHINFQYVIFDYVYPSNFTHMGILHVVVCTHLDPTSQRNIQVKMNTDPSTKMDLGNRVPIHTTPLFPPKNHRVNKPSSNTWLRSSKKNKIAIILIRNPEPRRELIELIDPRDNEDCMGP